MKLLVILSALTALLTLSSCYAFPDPVLVKSNQDCINVEPAK